MSTQAINPGQQRQRYMLQSDIIDAFKKRGWKSASGELFFDGMGASVHPHLHMRVSGAQSVPLGRDIRMAVTMLAWSNGKQGEAATAKTGDKAQDIKGGYNFIRNSSIVSHQWQKDMELLHFNAAMTEECAYVMSYFTLG